MAKTFEDSIPAFVDKMAKLSMEDVLLTKNRDKYIQEEIKSKVDIGNKELTDSEYNTSYFNKAIKQRRRELAEEANPLGARTGRATMKDGGPGIEALREVAPQVVERMGYEEGGDVNTQMEMMLGGEEETSMEEPMVPDETMEKDYLDFILDEALDEEEEDFLMEQLESNDRLSIIFDKVIDVATEFAGSGPVEGPGSGVSDSIPARLSDGEFVFTAKATAEIGEDTLMSVMKQAEAQADARQQVAEGGVIEEEENVEMPVQAAQQKDIRVSRPTVSALAARQEEKDIVGDEIKKRMMLDPNQKHVRS